MERAKPLGTGRFLPWLRRRRPRPVKVNTALRFYHQILGFDHLHYGLWQDDPLTLAGLKAAQERYARYLSSWIPPGITSILDVGCGAGATALMLTASGYTVEGLSPDPYQQQLFTRRTELPFHLVRFQDFQPGRRYDLVMMSESCQYIWFDHLFPAIKKTASGGFFLVADYFRKEAVNGRGPLAKSGHPMAAFFREAERHGLTLVRQEDITKQVLPTLDLAQLWLDRYVDPCLEIVTDSLGARHPHLLRLARWLFRGRLRQLSEAKQLVDSAEFSRLKRYLIALFQVPPASS